MIGTMGSPYGNRRTAAANNLNAAQTTAAPSAATYSGPFAGTTLLGQPFAVFLGAVALLAAFKFIGEHERVPSIRPAHMQIGGYNVLAVTITAMVGIVTAKLLSARWPIPGVAQFVNFV